MLKTVFFGTSSFGLPALRWLFKNTDLAAVVTTPDKPAGRNKELKPSPVKVWALENNLPLLQPNDLKSSEFQKQLKNLDADVGILASYGKIVPGHVIEIPRRAILNLHPSLLPKYRGATPIQAALLAGDKTTGTTLMRMDEKLDHGPMVAQKEIPIHPGETYENLHEQLAQESANLLSANLDKYVKGEIKMREQEHEKATFTKLLKKQDGIIDWAKSADYIEHMARAYNPWPGAQTKIQSKNVKGEIEEKEVKILRAKPNADYDLLPGEVAVEKQRFFVGTGYGALEIVELQPSGSRPMTTNEFLAGYRNKILRLV